jgi:murein L,D-transpeptidase YafK
MKLGRLALFIWLLAASPGFADDSRADHVLVKKSERMLYLMRGEDILGEYPIALGLAPKGHKVREGDFRTPEGNYFLTRRLVESDFFMAIEVSYPNRWDEAKASRLGVQAGGRIMIHGQPMEPKKPASYYATFDWTDGCIAVSNEAMVDIWQYTSFNTPITILP